ncbi:cadherin-87A [Halyomorpha halys]|uniref:cadherin-87A n=1 Tax=Halyomorpha halys TaxID=286706 RepID=UPI0006D4E128|nr:cadherin-87A [Halyomorpha halys]
MEWRVSTSILLFLASLLAGVQGNESPILTQDMDNTVLSENAQVGSVVEVLKGSDPEGSPVRFGISGTDRFSVNPVTGEVTLIRPLDREVNDTLRFFVTIEDDVNNLVQTPVSVIIIDVNDNPPVFKNEPYEVSVTESTAIETLIFSGILVEDSDLSGEILEVYCKDHEMFPGTCEKFEITTFNSSQESFHGGMLLKDKLNYSDRQLYQLLLIATDGTFNTTSSLEIKVLDVQDTPPLFQGSLTGVIKEDDPIGTLVMTVHAKDGDKGVPRKIVYDLLTNPQDYFLLDPGTGELRTAKPLDREALLESTGVLTLLIRAREIVDGVPGNDSLTSTTTMASVTIKDVNDEPPQFNQKEYHVKLSENTPLGTPLPNLNMSVTDSDVGVNSRFQLSLSDVSAAFDVEPSTGSGSTAVSIRVVNGPLDYENPNNRKFILLVIAEETETSQKLSSTATVTIEITDANDNVPEFDREAYSASVDETAIPGDPVTTITATDVDTGSFGTKGIVYNLVGHGAEKFNIDKKTGLITVAPCQMPGSPQCLDFETKPVYYLNLQATDDEGKGQTKVVPLQISLNDNNDNPPTFTSNSYKAIIDEGSNKFEPPLNVQARDIDKTSEVIYSIVDGNINNLFSIDPHSGEVTVTDRNGLDMTNVSSDTIHLIIQAFDGVFKVDCSADITVLDVNNNQPIFEQSEYTITVPEDSPTGTSVETVVAHDADTGINSKLLYRIEKGGFDDFGIDNRTGVVSVISKLDYDRRNNYLIHIIAVDGGTPALTGTTTLSISVANTNDKIPFFSPATQRAEIKEDARVGEVVHHLVAQDLDVNSTDALNFAQTEPITAVDKNGKEVEGDAFKDFFSVNQGTGVVTVARPLEREIAAIVRITVLVTDITALTKQQGTGTLIITIIDVNDYAPEFLKPWSISNPRYSVEVLEEQPPGTMVGTFTAVDQDSNNIWYDIEPPSEYFEINNITGAVKTKTRLDYEKTPSLEFSIVAYDSGIPPLSSTAHVSVNVVNINDMNPIFNEKEYTFWVEENAETGTIIGNVSATDGDAGEAGQVTYSLSAQSFGDFSIDKNSGEIMVLNKSKLDREMREEMTIQVIATDGAVGDEARSSIVPVHIKIKDVNDNAPVFSQHEYKINIVESIPLSPPAPILQLRAEDKDSSSRLEYSIVSGNTEDVFMLDSNTGIMYPRISLKNQLPYYTLLVQVSDGVHFDEARIDINVQAINQNQPVFTFPSNSNSTVFIKENDNEVGAVVLTVKAVDGDSGENGHITYHFKVRNENVQETEDFTIEADSGEVRAKSSLDRETKSLYHLVLVARDHGSPTWYEALRSLTIELLDVDDNVPEFNTLEPHVFHIKENAPPRSKIGIIEAIDRDEGENSKVYFYIVKDESKFFVVDKLNGTIISSVTLDREEKDSYDIYIKATNDPDYYAAKEKLDLKNLKASKTIAHIKIHVMDENDNEPFFYSTQYNAGVLVSTHGGEFVAQLTAADKDAGANGSLSYLILTSHLFRAGSNVSSGSVIPSPFTISETGKLTTAALVAEYNQERFKLEVIAKEKAPPYREAKAIVNIWIYEQQQLIRVILSRPPEEVHREKEQITMELSNVTKSLVVIDEIKYHVDTQGQIQQEWCDMYLHVVDKKTQMISTIPDVLKLIDSHYDFLKDYYAGFAIENVVPAYVGAKEETFEPALAALIALLIVLFVGCVSVIVVCCCFRHWIVSEPMDMKQSDMLIKKTVMDDLNTTENPLWIEQKLKLYEEQELTMQVFCEPENNQMPPIQPPMERRDSVDMSVVDNTYATIQHPNRRSSLNTMLSLGAGDYATLGGSVLPLDNVSSHSQQMFEAALGFQGSTFQVPENPDLFRARSELRVNKDGQPEFVSELI